MDRNSFMLQLTTSLNGLKTPTTKSVLKKVVDDFVKNHIICRFRIPESIVTYNGTNLNSDLMKALCERFKINHRTSTTYKPQRNEAVANKNIKRILRKMIDNYKHWHEKLLFALLGYHTTIRTSIGLTPYFLLYGNEVVIHTEAEISTLRIIKEAELSNAKWVENRFENLTLIDRRRINVFCHNQLYHNRMTRAFKKKVRPRHFSPRQFVLK